MERKIRLQSGREAQILFGHHDANAKILEKEFNVQIFGSGEDLKVRGRRKNVEEAVELIEKILNTVIRCGGQFEKQDLYCLLKSVKEPKQILEKERIDVELKGKEVGPRTKGQAEYVEAIKHYDIVFGI